MARHKVIHSDDACCVLIEGDKRSPEPSTASIKFPGGSVEVSRTSDGHYWAHIQVDDRSNVVQSRIDYAHEEWARRVGNGGECIPPVPAAEFVEHVAFLVAPRLIRNASDFGG